MYAGIQVKKTIILTMAISGGLIGLAGWIEIFGIQFRLLDGIAGGLGNTAKHSGCYQKKSFFHTFINLFCYYSLNC